MFWTQFTYLCASVGKSPNAVASELGIASGSITAWSKGTQPRNATVNKIAKYFGVTTQYLLFGDENIKNDTTVSGDVDSRDIEFTQLFNKLTDTEKSIVIAQMRGLVQGR